MFFKLLNAEELKTHKEKTKKLKREVRNLTRDSIITKLHEDLKLSQSRAEHFEREFFNLKRSLIFQADQELQSELYLMTKETGAMNLTIVNKDGIIADYVKAVEKAIDKIAKLTEENEALKSRVKELEPELTTDEVNDQVNQLLKPQ